MRDVWFESSYLLDRKQSGEKAAKDRFLNYKEQPLQFRFPDSFTGTLAQYGISADRRTRSGVKAAIIREKGVNGDREMAYSLYLAGFDVKDVHMTDLISGRETLDDINMIVYCGGFSNSDVLGSAKGWAGGFLWNEKAKAALDRFYNRPDTLSLGICNGCQLMVELGLLTPDHEQKPKMRHNDSHKFESQFIGLTIPENNSVMFGSLSGSKLGIWVAHGEGKFELPYAKERYNIVAQYTYDAYPANPNGSPYGIAGIASADGRHLAMMPHLERAIFPWQCGHYPADRKPTRLPRGSRLLSMPANGLNSTPNKKYIPQGGRETMSLSLCSFNQIIINTTTLHYGRIFGSIKKNLALPTFLWRRLQLALRYETCRYRDV